MKEQYTIADKQLEQLRQEALEMAQSSRWTYHQKVIQMAGIADRLIRVIPHPEGLDELIADGVICDLFEGEAPTRPRYICPDYEKLMRDGCEFLRLAPPTNLYEALQTLLIFYHHVPSVTTFPVFVGRLDKLLEPFVTQVPREEAKEQLKYFMMHIDRTLTDSFTHANLGPEASVTGELIMELERELVDAVPNMTLKYDKDITPDDFAIKAIQTQLEVAKPSIANHKMFSKELGNNYCIASCYNGLQIGGGAYTLVRMLLGHLSKKATGINDFLTKVLPDAMQIMAEYMDNRVKYIVEESGFFETNFLVKEGFIHADKFTSMFGFVGMAQCVNTLMEKEGKGDQRYGHSAEADELGQKIIKTMHEFVSNHENKHCKGADNRFLLHGQVGISTDVDETPAARIPNGDELKDLTDHLTHCSKFHGYCPSGIGDIFRVDEMARKNPAYVLDIVKGAFDIGCRYLSIHNSDSDVVRVTGYLAKRSDIDKLNKGERVLQDTTHLATDAQANTGILDRKIW